MRENPAIATVFREPHQPAGMNPLVFIIPGLIFLSGLACFFLLPLPLGVRLALLASDLVAAVLVGWILLRRHGGGG